METIYYKRGNTLSYTITVVDENDDPLDTPVANIRSEIRTENGALVDSLTIADTTTVGTYLLTAKKSGNDYPLGNLYTDIQFTIDGVISSSDTFMIEVQKDITQPVV